MKRKLLLLLVGVFTLGIASAHASIEPEPVNGSANLCKTGNGKKNNFAGQVVHAEKKNPLKDVSVTAYNSSKKEKTVLTDPEGGFAFGELKPGTYRFVFEKAGYKKVTRERTISKPDDELLLTIEMTELKAFELLPSPMQFTDF